MSLLPGARIGQYEVLSLAGKGGMGEVFRARDTELRREVAIKVLPEAVAHDPDRLARFEREARLLAALNHSNIATLHGLDRSGEMRFLVMELVPGETLAEALMRGPIPVAEALLLFRQLAEALEAAHERGIVHRDLKPANLKITPEGKLKVLDFGLAKALSEEPSGAGQEEESLTRTTPTQEGVVLGTVPYMSPEQARGAAVDRRTDVWAFGCVFYEALTGKHPFRAGTTSDTMAAILRLEPDWSRLPRETPPRIRELLQRTLKKDAARRLRDMGDARLEIEEANEPRAAAPQPRERPWLPWSIGLMGLTVAVLSVVRGGRPDAPSGTSRPVRFEVEAPGGATPAMAAGYHQAANVALSPDGSHVVFSARDSEGQLGLYLRPLDRLAVQRIPDTEGGFSPFFSPDGRSIGFFTDFKLKKVSLAGGAALTLADVPPVTRGASFAPDGSIVVAYTFAYGLARLSPDGSKSVEIAEPDRTKKQFGFIWPQVLPGGKAVLFTIWTGSGFDAAQIAILELPAGQPRVLVPEGSYARYIPSGQIVFSRGGSLLAVPFDLERLQLTGAPVPVLDDVLTSPATGAACFDVSSNGTLAYLGASDFEKRSLALLDRDGSLKPLSATRGEFWNPRLSLDRRQLAVQLVNDIWIYDFARDNLRRLTFEGISQAPVWSPDGRQVAYSVALEKEPAAYVRAADGSGAARRIGSKTTVQFPSSWSPEGNVLAVSETSGTADDWDVLGLPATSGEEPVALAEGPFNQTQGMFSPDGKWLAYVSDESGRSEVYLRPYPKAGAKLQLSNEGGIEPLWAPDGRELYYRRGRDLILVPMANSGPGKPRLLIATAFSREPDLQPGFTSYDVASDGRRFVVVGPSDPSPAPRRLLLTLNWVDELKRALAH